MDKKEKNTLTEESKVQLDIKALIGMVLGIISIAGVWFSLTAEISQLQLDVIRMQDDVELNHEFRVKWPRGEMGALPDDAKQDLRIEYLQKEVEKLRATVKELEIANARDNK
jgi:cell division protein FtsB|tara:strand:- start:4440 stop:4775 length:336 start_codon:yes stop_codon:yes gene_type:complete